MSSDRLKVLQEKLSEEKTNNIKLMWRYANWEYKLIIVIGYLACAWIAYKVGQYLVSRLMG